MFETFHNKTVGQIFRMVTLTCPTINILLSLNLTRIQAVQREVENRAGEKVWSHTGWGLQYLKDQLVQSTA